MRSMHFLQQGHPQSHFIPAVPLHRHLQVSTRRTSDSSRFQGILLDTGWKQAGCACTLLDDTYGGAMLCRSWIGGLVQGQRQNFRRTGTRDRSSSHLSCLFSLQPVEPITSSFPAFGNVDLSALRRRKNQRQELLASFCSCSADGFAISSPY